MAPADADRAANDPVDDDDGDDADPVAALLADAAGRYGGWRTPHTPAWRARALALLRLAPPALAPAVWGRVGAAVRDLGLLGDAGPALACAVDVASVPGDVLWRDVRHAVWAVHDRPADGRWLAALAVWLRRQRGVVVPRRAAMLARGCPTGALALALRPDAWAPAGVAPDQAAVWTRAVWVCWLVDAGAAPDVRAAAARWLSARPPEHGTRSLVALTEAVGDGDGDADDDPPPPDDD